jgi:hypothetical protein
MRIQSSQSVANFWSRLILVKKGKLSLEDEDLRDGRDTSCRSSCLHQQQQCRPNVVFQETGVNLRD